MGKQTASRCLLYSVLILILFLSFGWALPAVKSFSRFVLPARQRVIRIIKEE